MAGLTVHKVFLSFLFFYTVTAFSVDTLANKQGDPNDEYDAFLELTRMEEEQDPLWRDYVAKDFAYNMDSTQANLGADLEAQTAFTTVYNTNWQYVIDYYNFKNFTTYFIRRQFELQEKPGTRVLSTTDFNDLALAVTNMTRNSRSLVCPFDNQNCTDGSQMYGLNELEVVLATERRVDALQYYWKTWRDMAGVPTMEDYPDFVKLMNRAAVAAKNGYTDATGLWMADYVDFGFSSQDYQNNTETIWAQVKELYYNLHAYVRYRLRNSTEFQNTFNETSPIPANFLGDMFAEDWSNVYDLVVPYSDVQLLDISDALQQNITDVVDMFRLVEDFYTSIGFFNMTDKFYERSLFAKPDGDVAVNCRAASWDMYSYQNPQTEGDYRAEMCTKKNQEDFLLIHQIMGRIQYQMAYSELNATDNTTPRVMRNGANPSLYQAVGDAMILSASTQTHLEKVYKTITGVDAPGGNLTDDQINKRNLNQLMRTALTKIPALSYAYILDKYQSDIFSEKISEDQLNYDWWKYRVEVQGVKPPILRSRSNDFDAGSKYEVQAGLSSMKKFFGTVLQFQFNDRLCDGLGTESHLCDISGVKEAGERLRDRLMINGRLYPWVEQLAYYLESDGMMDAKPLLDYFKPLNDFLIAEIASLNIPTAVETDIDGYFSD